jgi:hypothetical protein
MGYLDPQVLSAIDATRVRAAKPYPWQSFEELIEPEAYARLLRDLPDPSQFREVFGRRRRYGQSSHDRYSLDYEPGMALADSWRGFLSEIHEGPYRDKVAELLGHGDFFLTAHWHYTPRGCSVSPHCDAAWKLGSHIFYFNDESEWDPAWGGATLVLDDGGEIEYSNAPAFEDFLGSEECPPMGNRSMIFLRTDHSWHGVEPLACPEGVMRRVFIVEYRLDNLRERFRARTGI